MKLAEIQTKLDAICSKMVEKGIREPRVELSLFSFSEMRACLEGKDTFPSGEKYKFIRGNNIGEIFAEASAFVAALSSISEMAHREYMSKIADAIDFAHDNDIDAKYVAPLRDVKKAMTDNLLTLEKS
jgi:hypothetical protein